MSHYKVAGAAEFDSVWCSPGGSVSLSRSWPELMVKAVAHGARVLTGGGRIDGKGASMQPTIENTFQELS
jgi:hypothetical protein